MQLRPTLVGAVLATALLAGCGASAGAGGGAGAHALTDAKGRTVQVPDQPQRVVTLSEPTLDAALTLGVPVVGTTSGRGQGAAPAYLAQKAAGIPIVGSVAGADLEQVAEVRPDLILVDGTVSTDDPVLDKLTVIAPTVYVSKTGEAWKTAFTAAADALGRADAAAGFLRDWDAKVAAAKGTLGPNAGATVSIVRWGSGAPSVLLTEIAASTVVAELGLTRPPAQAKAGKGHSEPVSLENLDQLDADWMFFGTLGGATSPAGGNSGTAADTAASRTALQKAAAGTPGFNRLRAYQLGHVVPVDGSAWTSAGGPQAELAVLADVTANLSS